MKETGDNFFLFRIPRGQATVWNDRIVFTRLGIISGKPLRPYQHLRSEITIQASISGIVIIAGFVVVLNHMLLIRLVALMLSAACIFLLWRRLRTKTPSCILSRDILKCRVIEKSFLFGPHLLIVYSDALQMKQTRAVRISPGQDLQRIREALQFNP